MFQCMKICVERFVHSRQRLPFVQTFDEAVEIIRKSQKILVVTGAGISVSCGIPDFRSNKGIYSQMGEYELDDPSDMFDLRFFRQNPHVFYQFAHKIYPKNIAPSFCHKFVARLEKEGKLLRNYTQNIDNLEEAAGISRLVQCHGSFKWARCLECGFIIPGSEIEAEIESKTVPRCSKCVDVGVIKPEIVFFSEQLPPIFHDNVNLDLSQTDCVLAIGSSLKVAPVSEILRLVPDNVPQILINLEHLQHLDRHFDVELIGSADLVTADLSYRLGWEIDGAQEWTFYEPNIYQLKNNFI